MLTSHQILEKIEPLLRSKVTYPVEVIRIANEDLGYKVRHFKENVDSIAGMVDHESKEILINPSDPKTRQRFTIAHEIGHVVLHKKNKEQHHRKDIKLNVYSDDIEEIEANKFAAMLLMPELEFRKSWGDYTGDIISVAFHFNVSKLAACIRANSLNLLSM